MAKTPKKTPKKPAKKAKKDAELDKLMENDAPAETTPATEGETPAAEAAPMLSVLAQYLKDSSFENPGAPETLRSNQPQPGVNIDLRIARQVFENNTVEVSILLKATAERDGKTVFIAELEYAGLFAIANIGLEQMQPLMMIECPRILFPYARKILGDMTNDGGFPPVMLDMPDFAGMFRDEMMRRAADAPIN